MEHYIESGEIQSNKQHQNANETDKGLTIDLWLYAGDTMSAARETFSKLECRKIIGITGIKGFNLSN